jgi:hypothetical protein
MSKFQEYIKAGIARFDYRNYIPAIPEQDKFARQYNNVWGAMTDTHMAVYEDGYVITGSICSIPDKFDQFLCSCFWGGMRFRDARLGSDTLSQYIFNGGFHGCYGTLNGDAVYFLKPGTEDDRCCDCGEMSCCTTESRFPRQFNKSIFENCKTIGDVVLTLNENFKGAWYQINLSNETQIRCGNDIFVINEKNMN